MVLLNDGELKRRIDNFLEHRGLPHRTRPRVDVSNGRVVVHGNVVDNSERTLVLSCCQRVAGVIKLVDEITVG